MPSFRKLLSIAIANPRAAAFQAFHLARRRSKLEPRWAAGWSLCPDFITFAITKRCNYRCRRCSAHSPETDARVRDAELTIADYRRIIDEVAPFRPAIYFCGGEPTLRPDLPEIIRYAKRKGLLTAMTTNASRLDKETAERLVSAGLDFVSVSLDADEAAHDRARGVPGAYRNVIRGIGNLKQARGRSARPHIKLVGIIDPENPAASRHVLEAAERLGVDEAGFGHLMFYPESVGKDQAEFVAQYGLGSGYITGMGIGKEISADIPGIRRMVEEIRNHKGVHTSIAQGFALDVEGYYAVPYRYPSRQSECLTPWFSAIVRPDGNVSPCMEFDLGNVRERKFLDIWNDPRWRLFRRLKARGERVPACFRCGEGQKIRFD